jgi:hypothetical protein
MREREAERGRGREKERGERRREEERGGERRREEERGRSFLPSPVVLVGREKERKGADAMGEQ